MIRKLVQSLCCCFKHCLENNDSLEQLSREQAPDIDPDESMDPLLVESGSTVAHDTKDDPNLKQDDTVLPKPTMNEPSIILSREENGTTQQSEHSSDPTDVDLQNETAPALTNSAKDEPRNIKDSSSKENTSSQPEDSQLEDGQPEDSPPEDGQPEDSPPEDSQPKDDQPQYSQPEDGQPQYSQAANGFATGRLIPNDVSVDCRAQDCDSPQSVIIVNSRDSISALDGSVEAPEEIASHSMANQDHASLECFEDVANTTTNTITQHSLHQSDRVLQQPAIIASSDTPIDDHSSPFASGLVSEVTPISTTSTYNMSRNSVDNDSHRIRLEPLLDQQFQPSPQDDYAKGSDRFDFGKHCDRTYREVARNHPDYATWALRQDDPSPRLEKFCQWYRLHGTNIHDPQERQLKPNSTPKKMNFGKYRSLLYTDVLQKDPSYCHWALNEPDPLPALAEFCDWLVQIGFEGRISNISGECSVDVGSCTANDHTLARLNLRECDRASKQPVIIPCSNTSTGIVSEGSLTAHTTNSITPDRQGENNDIRRIRLEPLLDQQFQPSRSAEDDYARGNDRFDFGKHCDRTYREVASNHPDYASWALRQQRPGPQLEKFCRWYRLYGMNTHDHQKQLQQRKPYSPNKRMDFGKYRDLLYTEVVQEDPSYCRWALSQSNPRPALGEFCDWLAQTNFK